MRCAVLCHAVLCGRGAAPSPLLHHLSAGAAAARRYSTLALFRLVDTCDGLAPGWDPKTPVPALPVDTQARRSSRPLWAAAGCAAAAALHDHACCRRCPATALQGVDKLFPAGGGPSLRWKIEKVEPRRGGPPGEQPATQRRRGLSLP